MTTTKTLETLQQLRDHKLAERDRQPAREQMVTDEQIETLDEWIHRLDEGRSLDGLIARQHEADHERLFKAMTTIEATERLAAELRQMEGHNGV